MKQAFRRALLAVGIVFLIVIAIGVFTSTDEEATPNKEVKAEDKATVEEPSIDLTAKYAEYAKVAVPKWTDDTLEVSDTSYAYIKKHFNVFPAFEKEDITEAKKMEDPSINIKMLNKNVDPYLENMLSFEGMVVSIEEMTLEESEDTVSLLHVADDAGNSYQVILFKSSGDILEEDYVRFFGAPLGPSSFDNVSGGTTNVQVFMGSHIEKL